VLGEVLEAVRVKMVATLRSAKGSGSRSTSTM